MIAENIRSWLGVSGIQNYLALGGSWGHTLIFSRKNILLTLREYVSKSASLCLVSPYITVRRRRASASLTRSIIELPVIDFTSPFQLSIRIRHIESVG